MFLENGAMDDIEWIRQGLKKPGKSKGGLAKAFGRSPSAISDLLAGTRQLKATEIKSAAEYLEVNPPGMSGDAIATQQIRQAPVRGVAAAGLWMEYDDLSGDAFEPIPVIPTKYTHAEQFAYKIAHVHARAFLYIATIRPAIVPGFSFFRN